MTGSVLVDRVSRVAARHGDAVAVESPRTTLTYRDLTGLAGAWAGLLAAPPGSVLALDVTDPAFLAPALLAARTAGLVPMPLDPHAGAARRRDLLDAARPALLMDVRATPAVRPVSADPRRLPDGAGHLGFTSGSQGPPKGVVGREEGIARFVDWEIATLGVRPRDRIAVLSPPTFDVVLRELFVALCAGARVVPAADAVRRDPRAVLPWLAEREVDVVHAVPGLAARWVAAAPGARAERLRWTLFAGEPLHACHVDAWRSAAPRTRVGNLYGPTETTLATFFHPVPERPRPGLQPVGRPLPGAALLCLDRDGDRFRIGVANTGGSFGYLDGTASDAERADLTRTGGVTVFRTRDAGSLDDDGNLVVHGRLDSRVKRRGVFVDLAVIEEAAGRVRGVVSVACVQTAPEADGAVVLCAETTGSGSVLRRELRRALGPDGPDRVVVLPRLPLSGNGKVDRGALRAAVGAGVA